MITPEEPLRLETVGVLRNGRRRYDPASKQRLVEACLQPGDVEQSMGLDPFQRAVFAFCNRRRDRIKLLIYDRSGFWMLLNYLVSYYSPFVDIGAADDLCPVNKLIHRLCCLAGKCGPGGS